MKSSYFVILPKDWPNSQTSDFEGDINLVEPRIFNHVFVHSYIRETKAETGKQKPLYGSYSIPIHCYLCCIIKMFFFFYCLQYLKKNLNFTHHILNHSTIFTGTSIFHSVKYYIFLFFLSIFKHLKQINTYICVCIYIDM